MGVLMESSQVNIHARNEPNHHRHAYYIVDKLGDRPAEERRVPQHPSETAEPEYYWDGVKLNPKAVRPRSPACDKSMPPPKKKWMKNYMEEEPLCVQQAPRNGIRIGPPPASAPIAVPVVSSHSGHPSPILSALPSLLSDSVSDLPRARSNSNGSSGPRAGTREVHNKLEKNRRAHLKECFETLRLQLPSAADDKKSSNLAILDSAIRFIQTLKRREKEFEHEMERLAREKISNQQKLSTLRREPTLQKLLTNHDRDLSMEVEETITSRISPLVLNTNISSSSLPIEMLCSSRSSPLTRLSPPSASSSSITLDLTTKSSRNNQASSPQVINLHSSNGTTIYPNMSTPPPHSIPIAQRSQSAQIISTFSHIPNGIVTSPKSLNLTVNPNIQSARGQKIGSVSSSLPTLTLSTVNPGSIMTVNQGQSIKQGQSKDGKLISSSGVNGQTAIVHPAQLQIQPLSQLMNGGSLVVSPTIQLISTNHQGLRVLQTPIEISGSVANNSIQRIRDNQKIGDGNVGIGVVNGTLRTSSEQIRSNHHHIAIKPQPNTNLRPANSQGIHMMNGITPLVVSQGTTHIMTTSSHIAGKVMGGTLMKSGMNQHIPLAVNTQYLSAATLVKPVVVVSTSNGVPPTSS